MVSRGSIQPLTSRELLTEMSEILKRFDLKEKEVLFRANHVSNTKPIGGTLPKDSKAIITTLEHWIQETPKGVFPPTPSQM